MVRCLELVLQEKEVTERLQRDRLSVLQEDYPDSRAQDE